MLGLFDDDDEVVARSMGSVPPNFELETATDLHELIYALARPMQAFRGVTDDRVLLTDFAQACRFVRDFPRSHWDLDQLDLGVRSDFKRRLEGVFRHSRYPVVQTEVKRILEYGRPRRPYVCRKFKQPLFDVTRAAAFLHVQRGDVRRLVAAGHLKARPMAGGKSRGHYVMRRKDVEALDAKLKARMGWREFCSNASLPTLALEQMLASGVLRPREDPAVLALFGDRQICLTHAEAFLDRFNDLPQEDAEGWPSLKQVMWGVGGREKPWARVLDAGLTGELPGGLRRDPDRPGFGNLKVHPITAASLIMGGPDSDSPFAFSEGDYGQFLRPSLRPGEVEAHLNCTAQDVSWLRYSGHLRPTNEKGHPTIYSRAEVEAVGRRFITTREIAARLGVKPKDVWIRLEGLRTEAQIGQGFYDRSLIEGVISRPPRCPAALRT
ncbi:MAG: helix-turn-helix domain-containing protein [Brevundimonas sp.]|nr:helix-turn-helix domain-containing protein [Brevundimonas sp.]